MARAEKPVGGALAATRREAKAVAAKGPSHRVSIQRASRAAHVPSDTLFRRWVNAALAGRVDAGCELTLRVVGPNEMQALNREYRGKDYATNVLSFPFEQPDGVELPVRVLGDIVLCAATVQREAREQGKPVAAHWAHLVVHGVLHLLGMEHESDRQARVMEGAEIAILKELGFPNPYL